jgi:hypothetical protein
VFNADDRFKAFCLDYRRCFFQINERNSADSKTVKSLGKDKPFRPRRLASIFLRKNKLCGKDIANAVCFVRI